MPQHGRVETQPQVSVVPHCKHYFAIFCMLLVHLEMIRRQRCLSRSYCHTFLKIGQYDNCTVHRWWFRGYQLFTVTLSGDLTTMQTKIAYYSDKRAKLQQHGASLDLHARVTVRVRVSRVMVRVRLKG